MTTFTAPVGALTLPLPAGASGERIADPALDAVLAFLAWSLNNDLNAKLVNLPGTSPEAVPSGRSYAFDPTEPRAFEGGVKLSPPQLFVWRVRKSVFDDYTVMWRRRIGSLRALYVFQELPRTADLVLRGSIFNAVDASLAKACDMNRHPSYQSGRTITALGGNPESWSWSYVGAEPVERFGIDEPNERNAGRKVSGRDFPAIAAVFEIQELVRHPTPVDPDDFHNESDVTLAVGDGHDDPILELERIAQTPQGDT